MLGQLIGGFIVILVGVTLIPTIADQVEIASCRDNVNLTGSSCNVSSTSTVILGLTTLFFALGIVSAGIAMAVQALKAAGIM